MADTLLKVDNINVYYGNIHAVKGISFEVNQGEIVTLIGANGAGKSTTLKTISGLLKPKTGDILYKGSSIKGMRAHKIVEAGLAHVPEGRHVFLDVYKRQAWNTAGQSSRLQEKIGRKQNGTRAAAKAVRVPEDQLVFNSFSALR